MPVYVYPECWRGASIRFAVLTRPLVETSGARGTTALPGGSGDEHKVPAIVLKVVETHIDIETMSTCFRGGQSRWSRMDSGRS